MDWKTAGEPKKILGGVPLTTQKFLGHGYARQKEFMTEGDMFGRPGTTTHGEGGNMPRASEKKKQGARKSVAQFSTAHLDKLIEEATVDCYNESEEVTGIFTMLEENLTVPFITTMLGVEVKVERVDLNKAGEIVAVCRRGRERQRVPVIDLPLPEPKPKGAEWIDAYQQWARWRSG